MGQGRHKQFTNYVCLSVYTVTDLWLVLTAPTHEGMARLS